MVREAHGAAHVVTASEPAGHLLRRSPAASLRARFKLNPLTAAWQLTQCHTSKEICVALPRKHNLRGIQVVTFVWS